MYVYIGGCKTHFPHLARDTSSAFSGFIGDLDPRARVEEREAEIGLGERRRRAQERERGERERE